MFFFYRFILYFSALCDDAKQGKNLLRAAINDLLKLSDSELAESGSVVEDENAEVKPTLLWSALYIQELTTVCFSLCIILILNCNSHLVSFSETVSVLFQDF